MTRKKHDKHVKRIEVRPKKKRRELITFIKGFIKTIEQYSVKWQTL